MQGGIVYIESIENPFGDIEKLGYFNVGEAVFMFFNVV